MELTDEQRTVRAIHRLIDGLVDVDPAEALAATPGCSPAGTATAEEVHDGRVLAAMDDLGAIAMVGADVATTLLGIGRGRVVHLPASRMHPTMSCSPRLGRCSRW